MAVKILVVGGVAGGASAAARARRLDETAEIVMFERGEYISFANCGLPYYIGGVIKERNALLVTTEDTFRSQYNIDIRTQSEVLSINPGEKWIEIRDHRAGSTYRETYDKLILSQGAAPIKPPLPGIDAKNIFSLRTIPDADDILNFIKEKNPKRAVVVGGGFIGLEMMENLHHRGIHVTLIEMASQVLAPVDAEMAAIVHNYIRTNGIRLLLNEGVKSFSEEKGETLVHTTSGITVPTDMVMMAIGVKPENQLAKNAGLKIGQRGGIKTDEYMQTSDPDIYAVGDAAEVTDFVLQTPTQIPLAGPANKQGRIAADNALGRKVKFNGTQGTSVVKIFDMVAGATGPSEKALKNAGIAAERVFVHLGSHASYYPGAQMMAVKLLFDPVSGRVLGGQIVGMEGVDKRIDVIATAIRGNMTVFDLEELELTYAPPFSSARDPVNVVGMVAANSIKKDAKVLFWDQVEQLNPDEYVILDVREKAEAKISGSYEKAELIPLGRLRDEIGNLDKNKKYAVHCASGKRSYLATRILMQKGFDVRNISGGYKSYKEILTDRKAAEVELPPAGNNQPSGSLPDKTEVHLEVSACGIQCPGPIMKLNKSVEEIENGQVLKITASDPGFHNDVQAWCNNTGNRLMSVSREKGIITAFIQKGTADEKAEGPSSVCPDKKSKTIIVFSNDLDRVMASFIIANGAASMGSKVTMFFTFWGLNVLRRKKSDGVKKDLLEQMFGAMMPKGPEALSLSKMHMMGMGTAMMKHVMHNKNVQSLDMLIDAAKEQGVRLVACTMTMDIMGIKSEELIDGVEEGGVASYLNVADDSNLNLFI